MEGEDKKRGNLILRVLEGKRAEKGEYFFDIAEYVLLVHADTLLLQILEAEPGTKQWLESVQELREVYVQCLARCEERGNLLDADPNLKKKRPEFQKELVNFIHAVSVRNRLILNRLRLVAKTMETGLGSKNFP